MQITKGSLVNGALVILRVSGLTVSASPEDISDGLNEADDLALELKGNGIDIGWQLPAEYGFSDPADTSGLVPETAGAFKSLLAYRMLDYFGKAVTPSLQRRHDKAMRTIENFIITVPTAQNPPTLPFGSGNEWDYTDRRFYPEPAVNNDASYVFKGDVLNYTEDFSQWLVDEELESVTWESTAPSSLAISNQTFTETTATATLTFNQVGGYTVCITATKSNSTDVFTVQKNFIIQDCKQTKSYLVV